MESPGCPRAHKQCNSVQVLVGSKTVTVTLVHVSPFLYGHLHPLNDQTHRSLQKTNQRELTNALVL